MSDVKLVCRNSESIMAHKAILAARSQYFSQLFKESMQYLRSNPPTPDKSGPEGGGKPTSTAPIAIAAIRPSHYGDTPFLTHGEMLEEASGPVSPANHADGAKWEPGLDEVEDALSDISLSITPPQLPVPAPPAPSTSSAYVSTKSSPTSVPYKPSPYSHIPTTKAAVSNASAPPSRLSTRSPTFPPCRFVDGMLEIEIRNVDYDALKPIIIYLYTMNVDVTVRNLVSVFLLAHDLGLSTLKPEILNVASSLYTVESVVEILKEASGWPQCKPLREALFAWLAADLSRSRSLLHSSKFSELPLSLVSEMIAHRLFPDEYEVYERFCEISSTEEKGGEVDQLLRGLNFQRMSPEQLLRVHKMGRIKDRVILEAFKTKVAEGVFTPHNRSGTCILLEVTLFGNSASSPLATSHHHHGHHQQQQQQQQQLQQRHAGRMTPRSSISSTGSSGAPPAAPSAIPSASSSSISSSSTSTTSSSSSSEQIHALISSASAQSRTAISGLSPATLIRRRSVAVTVPIPSEGSDSFMDTETWHSEPFQVHSGNWSAIVKTRGSVIYKLGMTLNHTTTDCESIQLDSWSMSLEAASPATAPQSYTIDFSPSTFHMGSEIFKPVDIATSTALGFGVRQHAFKRPSKATIFVRVQFPIPSKIYCREVE